MANNQSDIAGLNNQDKINDNVSEPFYSQKTITHRSHPSQNILISSIGSSSSNGISSNRNSSISSSNQKNNNPIKLMIVPSYDNSNNSSSAFVNSGSLRNTPHTPSSSNSMPINFNGYYNHSMNFAVPSNLSSPISAQRSQHQSTYLQLQLYNNYSQSTAAHYRNNSSSSNNNNSNNSLSFSTNVSNFNFNPNSIANSNSNSNVSGVPPRFAPLSIDTSRYIGLNDHQSTSRSYNNLQNIAYMPSLKSPEDSPSAIRSSTKNLNRMGGPFSLQQYILQPDELQSPITPSKSRNFSQLPTHYENNVSFSQPQLQQSYLQQLIVPPPRAPAPLPHFTGDSIAVRRGNGHKRGKSMGMISTDNQVSIDMLRSPIGAYTPRNHETDEQQKKLYSTIAVQSKEELNPVIHSNPKYRRITDNGTHVSPLDSMTQSICTTYSLCRPEFEYKSSKNPRRVLTIPSTPKMNDNSDNIKSDLIIHVNDVLGSGSRRYLVLDLLGCGAFGQVAKVQDLNSKELLAVKVIKSDPACAEQSVKEVSILAHINSIDKEDIHHFLRLKDKFFFKNHLCIAFELLSSNLYEIHKNNDFNGIDMGLVKSFGRQLLESLIVLKNNHIIHSDLKPENILLVKEGSTEIKVIDFGNACYEYNTVFTYIQSRFYRSPEVLLGLSYNSAIDMWSFGCIVAELFLGLPLLPGSSEYNQITRMIDLLGMPPSWMIEMGKFSSKFIEKTTDPNFQNGYPGCEYKLKSIEKYSKEFHKKEKPSINYFNSTNLYDIIMGYYPNMRKDKRNGIIRSTAEVMQKQLTPTEIDDRNNLLHFLKGILNFNPLERWTPQQAILHPFIIGGRYDENWYPPGVGPMDNTSNIPTPTSSVFNNISQNGNFLNYNNNIHPGQIQHTKNNSLNILNLHVKNQHSASASIGGMNPSYLHLDSSIFLNGQTDGNSANHCKTNSVNKEQINQFKFPTN